MVSASMPCEAASVIRLTSSRGQSTWTQSTVKESPISGQSTSKEAEHRRRPGAGHQPVVSANRKSLEVSASSAGSGTTYKPVGELAVYISACDHALLMAGLLLP
jgi:hypothetical protein